MNEPEREEQHLQGGVIIENNDNWYYSKFPITTTSDVTGWEAWYPEEYK